jgi:hypothetical protein
MPITPKTGSLFHAESHVGNHRSVGDPAGDQHVDRDTGSIKVFRHDRAERLEPSIMAPLHLTNFLI